MNKVRSKIVIISLLLLSLILVVSTLFGSTVAENDDPRQELTDDIIDNTQELDLDLLQQWVDGLDSSFFGSLKETIIAIAQGQRQPSFDQLIQV
ncbi:MAG: hypothetical protein ACI4MV_05025, partial [Christensenellales bacterium]